MRPEAGTAGDARQMRQQQQQQAAHKHLKTNHTAVTEDGWRLHIVRTQPYGKAAGLARTYPVVLVPGLCSSGAYTFDLSPAVSLADWLADNMWDVWTIELRGNGRSDKPSLFSSRSHWWTVDDMVDKDLPACLDYITLTTGCTAVHCMGHSMGGMILTAALAKNDATSRRMRSVALIGSTCFLQGSWWALTKPAFKATRLLFSVPAGATLRLYSNFAFTRMGVRAIDILYFWPSNTDPALARAVLARNFSSTSPGVINQFSSAFQVSGLRSSYPGHPAYCSPERLAAVTTPVFMICGDRDKMCPPWGAAKQFGLFGSPHKRLVILGPRSGMTTHYGHFDILMGKRAPTEVWPQLQEWLVAHDTCRMDEVAGPIAIPPPAAFPAPQAPAPPARATTAAVPAAAAEQSSTSTVAAAAAAAAAPAAALAGHQQDCGSRGPSMAHQQPQLVAAAAAAALPSDHMGWADCQAAGNDGFAWRVAVAMPAVAMPAAGATTTRAKHEGAAGAGVDARGGWSPRGSGEAAAGAAAGALYDAEAGGEAGPLHGVGWWDPSSDAAHWARQGLQFEAQEAAGPGHEDDGMWPHLALGAEGLQAGLLWQLGASGLLLQGSTPSGCVVLVQPPPGLPARSRL